MFNFLKHFFDYNSRELQRIKAIVAKINSLEEKVKVLTNEDFPSETKKLKQAVVDEGKSLEELLPWSFALVREAARRVLGQRHFDTQLIAGIALHEGKIAEQKTGEGKTLSATAALYLNALTGRGVHLVTVNDYLARRDAGWMGMIFNFLGLTTAAIISDHSFIFDPNYTESQAQDWRLAHLRPISRRDAYLADITYGINSEFGFDYLRDNMAMHPDDIVQRGFYYAIVDEADSVLIDEARTPHIISAPYEEDTSKYYKYAHLVRQLNATTDYLIDEKLRTVHLTEQGISRVESFLGVNNIYEKDYDTLFHIEAALKALTLFKLDKDYIVKNGEVIIVDEFTGRLLPGRRFSEGLHQAIEAKEGVAIKQESKTLATVSLQNYFRMYEKLAGMTGTAATSAEEFNKIYKTDVLVVPTYKPMIRKDHPDMIYKTEKAKYHAVVEEIARSYQVGRPVLVGTTSIEKNEYLSHLLKQKSIPHELLNAKNHEREAQIIARAGEKGAITVATNMAGRGVDIILGGSEPIKYTFNSTAEYQKALQNWQKRHDEVVALGGLYVIGTERHEARTIDNQLRGRAGRQGDPGETRFFVSLADDLMRIFGGEQISRLMTFFNFPEDQPLSHPMVSRAIEQAQIKVEGFNFDIRKHLVEFDDVLNKQREIIYSRRKKLLLLPSQDSTAFTETVLSIITEGIAGLVNNFNAVLLSGDDGKTKESFIKDMLMIFPASERELRRLVDLGEQKELQNYLLRVAQDSYQQKEKLVGQEVWQQIVRSIFLTVIDQYWTQHLTAIEDLREGINLRGYAQLDPLVEYKNEAFRLFEQLLSDINYESVRRIYRLDVKQNLPFFQPSFAESTTRTLNYLSASAINPFTQENRQNSTQSGQMVTHINPHRKLGRNDKCWCGSGKKYKRCHYPN